MFLAPLVLAATSFLFGPEKAVAAPGTDSWPNNHNPAAAATADGFLAAWTQEGLLYAMPFDDAMQPKLPLAQRIASNAGAPAIAANGSEAVMFWNSNGGVSAQTLGDAPRTVSPARAGYDKGGRTFASWNGAHYVVLTTSLRFVNPHVSYSELAVIVDGVAGPVPLGEGVAAGTASAAGKTLIITITGGTLSGRFVSDDGNVSAPFTLATNVVRATAASNDTEFFAAWISDNRKTYSTRLDAAGTMSPLTEWFVPAAGGIAAQWDGSRFIIRTGDDEPALARHNGISALVTSNHGIRANGSLISLVRQGQLSPVAIRQGSSVIYLVTPDHADTSLLRSSLDGTTTRLHEHAGAFAAVDEAIISTDGTYVTIDRENATSFRSATKEQLVAIASNGAVQLGVWRSGFAVKGSLGETEFQISDAAGQPPVALSAAWNGRQFVVVWAEGQPVVFGGWLIKSATIDANGTVSPERVVMTLPIGGTMMTADAARLAWTTGNELRVTRLDDLSERVFTNSDAVTRVQLAPDQLYWTTQAKKTWFVSGDLSPVLIAEDVNDPWFATNDRGPLAMTYVRYAETWQVFVRTMTPLSRRRAVSGTGAGACPTP